jgi:hypothetical protein
LDEGLREALEARGREQGKPLSEVAREILGNALEERPLEIRTGPLQGSLSLGKRTPAPWREELRHRNWRV